MNTSRIILALDGMSVPMALEIAGRTEGFVWGYKANDLLIDKGQKIVKDLADYGRVMTDPKFFDISNTMTSELVKYKNAGADIITVHVRAKYKNPPEEIRDHIAGVSILTSEDLADLEEDVMMMVDGPVTFQRDPITCLVKHYARKAEAYRYGYLVCSAQIVGSLKDINIKKICPAIRPKWSVVDKDDQNPDLIATPRQAILNGADLLVIGRPILTASNIVEAIKKTNQEVDEALAELG